VLVDPVRLAGLFAVALAVIAVPGPSVLLVVSRGVAQGRAAALATVAGTEIGLAVQVATVAFGLGAIVERSIAVYTVIKLLGAAYLVFLGVQAIRHRKDLAAAPARTPPTLPTRRILADGALVGVLNPKGFLLFAAILPQFTDAAVGHVQLQMLLLGGFCVLISLVSDSIWALLAGSARTWLVRSPRTLETVGAGSGMIMISLGVQVALSGRRD
jgi:threonine/homoserine/homoserine lactone efflux protein